MTRRLRVWVLLLTSNAALIGWSIAARPWTDALAPVVVMFALGWTFDRDVYDAHACAHERELALDFLEEVLDEHGPMECDPDCGCVACRARSWLAHLAVLGAWTRTT